MEQRIPGPRPLPPVVEEEDTLTVPAADSGSEQELASTRVLSPAELAPALDPAAARAMADKSRAGSASVVKANVVKASVPKAAMPKAAVAKAPRKPSAGKSLDGSSLGDVSLIGKAPHQTHHEEDTAIVSPTQEPAEPTVLKDYQLLKKIGEGAMGAVYKARRLSFNQEVALKVLFPHVANNPKLVERLYREGRVLGQLDHPNIVQAVDVDEDQGYHYVAMEFIEGESLQKWLTRMGRMELADALFITLACARALGYAHEQGFVHRDIKPDNILITRKGQVKVADFGMAKVKGDQEEMGLTQTGHAVGTPWYMPLEQASNAKTVDGRCDIYALGCVLYCMLTGNPPFVGRTIVEVIEAKRVGTFAPARSSNPDVPERLDLILAKMTAKLPQYRYQNCGELIQDIESLKLAGKKLQFLDGKPPQRNTGLKVGSPGPSVEVNLDVWFVNIAHNDGASTLSKLSTQQLKKMLEDGSVSPTARASHDAKGPFRALATYKEFQGTALSRVSRKAADEHGARFRNLMKKIEEKDRERDDKANANERRHDPLASYWHSLWLPSLMVAGGVLVLFFLWYIVTGLVK